MYISLYIYMCKQIYINILGGTACRCGCILIYIYILIYVCIYIFIYIYMSMYIDVHTQKCGICMHIYTRQGPTKKIDCAWDLYFFVYVYTNMYIHICMYMYTHIPYTHVCVYARTTHKSVRVCHLYTCACAHVCMCVCACVCVSVHICIYLYLYLSYVYTHMLSLAALVRRSCTRFQITYGVATVSRLLKIIGLFCRITSLL